MQKIKLFFLNLVSKFSGLSEEFWVALRPVLLNSAKSFLNEAFLAAIPLVVQMDTSGLSGEAKRAQVVATLISLFLKDGKTLATNIANLAVEMAVAHTRSNS